MDNTKKARARSRTRLEAREVERKLMPAIKLLSNHLHNTTQVAPSFKGYKVPVGEFSDTQGHVWQVQAHAVCRKKDRIRTNKIIPMIDKWALGMKLRVWSKMVIDNLFGQ